MSLLNSLYSGVSGIQNHQAMMDVIGNNISNVNSIGFKGSRVTFSDAFNQFVRYGTNPTDSSGGTNSYQLGLGMKINSIDRNWTQGTFERTGIVTDLALQGRGLFVLDSNGERFYSRAGAFVFDAEGKLVNPQNGAIVQGKVATTQGVIPPGNNLEDIIIDVNQRLPAVATTETTWGGNLDSNSTITRSEEYIQTGNINAAMGVGETVDEENTIYDELGNSYTFKVTYEKTGAGAYDMTYELRDEDDNLILDSGGIIPVTFDDDPVSPDYGKMLTLNGAPPAAIGIVDSALGINFDFDPTAVTQTDNSSTVTSSVDDNREPTIITGTVTIFDSLGNATQLSITFTKTLDNSWRWSASVPEEDGTLPPGTNTGSMTFNADGSISTISPNPPVLNFVPNGGASSQNIELKFGSGFDGVTQTSANSVLSALGQNGSAAATLSNLNIDQYGYLVGVYTNGQSKNLAQILLATFPNLNGLTSAGDNMFSVSPNAGVPLIGEPGEATGTTMQSGALEQSNVDLSEAFTRMIVSQRGFQASARVVTVSDNLLQEVTNMIR